MIEQRWYKRYIFYILNVSINIENGFSPPSLYQKLQQTFSEKNHAVMILIQKIMLKTDSFSKTD